MVLTGGCLCGAVRYRIDGELTAEGAGFCHCGLCRRASGAPVVAWGTWRAADFRFTDGRPAEYLSSPKGVRRFCPACGIHPYGEGKSPDGAPMAAVNIRCIEGIDLATRESVSVSVQADLYPGFRDPG